MLGTTWRRHAAIVRELDIPVPFELSRFVASLERQRRRAIQLCPFSSGPGTPCGMWIGTPLIDYIFHEQETTPYHRTHIVLHEIAHMLLGHKGGTRAGERLVTLLAPDVDPRFVESILGRSGYSVAEEEDAEVLASLIRGRSGDLPQPAPVPGPETGAFISLLERAWGGSGT